MTTTELSIQERAAIALQSSNQTRLDLAAMALKSVGLVEIKNKAGRDEVHGAAMELARARVAITKISKAARDDATKFSKACIAEENSLIEITIHEENRLIDLRESWDKAIAAEKAAKQAAEKSRILKITALIAEINAFQTSAQQCRTSSAIQALMTNMDDFYLDNFDLFEEFEEEANLTKVKTFHALESIYEIKKAQEIERAKLKEDQEAAQKELEQARAEIAKIKAEQAKIEKQNRDNAVMEADRLATERQRIEDEQKAFEAKSLAIIKNAEEVFADYAKPKDEAPKLEIVEPKPVNQTRPSDIEILEMIAAVFVVSDKTAFSWLQNMDLKALQTELLSK